MTATNRVRVAVVRESTFGTTPGSARMRTARVTGEGIKYAPQFVNSAELRADRMSADPIKVNESTQGPLNFEMSYPITNTFISELIVSALWNDWVKTPEFDNDGTADSVITDAGTTANTYAVASGGAAVKLGHLVRATGFAQNANNQIFRAASSTGTTIVGTSLGLVAETAPAANARLKVVGFAGVSGDITAAAGGLASTTLDFTTLGIVPGQWLKIGGTAAGDKFATAANNDWVRVSGTVTANSIPLDNLPSGWGVDSGTGKTIKVWFGDQIRNGTTRYSMSIERGFLGQATPTYIVARGAVVQSMDINVQAEQIVNCSASVLALTSAQGTVAYGTTYDAATTAQVMSGSVNVGRIAESGAVIASPNWAKSVSFKVDNGLRPYTAVDAVGAVDIQPGEFNITGQLSTYFGSNALLTKLLAGTVGAVNSRLQKNSQAIVFQVPRATFTDGAPNAAQKNSDVMLDLQFTSSIDSTTGAEFLVDRLEYYET